MSMANEITFILHGEFSLIFNILNNTCNKLYDLDSHDDDCTFPPVNSLHLTQIAIV